MEMEIEIEIEMQVKLQFHCFFPVYFAYVVRLI